MSPTALRPMTAHNNLHALLFQLSAEYVALCHQSYQLARQALLDRLSQGTFRNPAVVFDLDETLLDNSAYQAWQLRTGTNFDEKSSWRKWCNAAQAEAVPGGVEFVRFVRDQGAVPLFITSREDVTRVGTLGNLAALGIISQEEHERELGLVSCAEISKQTLLFMKGMGDVVVPRPSGNETYPLKNKFQQRVFLEQVREFEVILSVGDNLSDYAEYYGRVLDADGTAISGQHPLPESRRNSALQDARLFGRDFILLPNGTYGGWLRAYEGNGLGTGDELAGTGDPVRKGLEELQTDFTFVVPSGANPMRLETVTPKGPKLVASRFLRIWTGSAAPQPVKDDTADCASEQDGKMAE